MDTVSFCILDSSHVCSGHDMCTKDFICICILIAFDRFSQLDARVFSITTFTVPNIFYLYLLEPNLAEFAR